MKIWPSPLINLLMHISQHGIHLSKLLNILPWIAKFLLFEPFRWFPQTSTQWEIKKNSIKTPPLFILGYYRSGTTYLQRLLLQDKRFACQTVVDTAYPEYIPNKQWLIMPFLNIWKKLFNPVNKFQRIPLQWDQPGEEDLAMLSSGLNETVTWGFLFPSAFETYFNRYALFNDSREDVDKWKKNYISWIIKLSSKYDDQRLLLKNPPNMARIPQLLELFPDAKFIFIHRNPENVFSSGKYLWEVTEANYSFQKVGKKRVEELILYCYRMLIESYLENRSLIPKNQLYELSYEQLVGDPVSRLKELYEALDLLEFNTVKPKLIESLKLFNKYKQTDYSLSEREQLLIHQNWGTLINKLTKVSNS